MNMNEHGFYMGQKRVWNSGATVGILEGEEFTLGELREGIEIPSNVTIFTSDRVANNTEDEENFQLYIEIVQDLIGEYYADITFIAHNSSLVR